MLRLLESRSSSKARLWSRICDGTYGKPFVLDVEDRRQLHFDLDAVQSAMSLSDPARLVLSYTRKMACFLLFCRQPTRVLILGLGGGSLAKFCYRFLPDSTITIVEINRDVIRLRKEFGIPDDDCRFRVIHDDGLSYLKSLPEGFDVILADACDRAGTAPDMASLDFYLRARTCLTQRGVLVANVCGPSRDCSEQLSALDEAFDDGSLAIASRRVGNTIVFCFRDPGTVERWTRSSAIAQQLKRESGLNFPRYQRLIAPRMIPVRPSIAASGHVELLGA